MRHHLLIGSAVAVLMATPAFADVDVTVISSLDKDIDVFETITIDIDVSMTADVVSTAEKFAESIAAANQANYDNKACTNCAEKSDLISNSGTSNTGVVSMNQASGNFNNQGTLISAAVDVDGSVDTVEEIPGSSGFAEASATADQRNGTPDALPIEGDSFAGPGNEVQTVNILFRDAEIIDSLNANVGLVYANQSAGNNANQANVLSIAFSLDESGVALSDADLGQVNANNTVGEARALGLDDDLDLGIVKDALTSNSLNSNVGIVGVNQTVGNMSNQANVVSVAAVGSALPTFAAPTP